MSFNDIRLPNSVLVDFYKSALVDDIPEKKQKAIKIEVSEQAAFSQIKHLGENRKNILVLVYYPQEQHLPGEQLDFLSTILSACNLNIADIAIVNTAHLQGMLAQLISSLNPKVMLLLGTQTSDIMGNTTMIDFKIINIDGVLMVSSPPLESFNNNNNESKSLKRKLWECLKQLLNV